jgi:hypothetical protein
MPKPSQSISIAEQCKRIDIGYLFKNGFIENHCEIYKNLSWFNFSGSLNGTIRIESTFTDLDKSITLIYTASNQTGLTENISYKINLIGVPSNLGKGNVYYFECPLTKRRCRILYLAYGSLVFKSRYAYNEPIYYEAQVCSKRDYANTRYWKLRKEFEKLSSKEFRIYYDRKHTRSFKRLVEIRKKLLYFGNARFQNLSRFLSILSQEKQFKKHSCKKQLVSNMRNQNKTNE